MVFNSLTFVVFFACVLALHSMPFAWTTRKINLLIASYLFYAAWNPPFVILLWISTVVDWYAAQGLVKAEKPTARRAWMLLSVVVNLGMLGYFKYGTFMLENFKVLMAGFGVDYQPPSFSIVLPVGISFYTFATLSYTLDVYLRRAAPARNFLDYALFVTFFPHLVAGPIMRPTELVPQFAEPRRATATQLRFGLALMTLGLFQKIVLADSFLAKPAEMVYDGTKIPGVLDAWIATLAFSGPDLLRFRRLLDDRDRRRDVPRLRDAGQLPLSVCGGRLLGFLAALAHHAVVVAARLPLHSARRQPARRGAHVHRADDDDAARRPLARRELGVRRLGRIARALSLGRARTASIVSPAIGRDRSR